jgi:hypothetical protein
MFAQIGIIANKITPWRQGCRKDQSMNDTLIVSMYRKADIPCDPLVSNPALLSKFTREYNQATGERVTDAEMGHRLLNIRRRGEAKGGLPRLRRRYNGRN